MRIDKRRHQHAALAIDALGARTESHRDLIERPDGDDPSVAHGDGLRFATRGVHREGAGVVEEQIAHESGAAVPARRDGRERNERGKRSVSGGEHLGLHELHRHAAALDRAVAGLDTEHLRGALLTLEPLT